MTDIKSWTGERLETFVYNENTNEHLHRYALALQLVAGKKVLDIACGEGYGSRLMADLATEVIGVDIDAATIEHATNKYRKTNLLFLPGSTDKIPCKDGHFDMVVSFETIEHHDRHDKMIEEIKRVLRPGGLLLISSPDKLYYSDKTGYKNPFHVKELYRNEFETLLNTYFKHTHFMGQKSFFGSVIVTDTPSVSNNSFNIYEGNYNAINQADMQSVYTVALASDEALPNLGNSLLDGAEVLKKQFDDLRELVTQYAVADVTNQIKSSWTYKIGHFIIAPFQFIKKVFRA